MLVAVDALTALAGDRQFLGRTGMAERVAEVLRERIIDGSLPPATRLSEDQIARTLGVSRNTLRESFKLLAHERLLEHKLNRGVFVRQLDAADVIDIYRVRRLVEVAAVRSAGGVDTSHVTECIQVATEAAEHDRWGTSAPLTSASTWPSRRWPAALEWMRQCVRCSPSCGWSFTQWTTPRPSTSHIFSAMSRSQAWWKQEDWMRLRRRSPTTCVMLKRPCWQLWTESLLPLEQLSCGGG